MSVRRKLDEVISALHAMIATPDATDAARFHRSIQAALSDLPEPSRPSGLCSRPDSSPAVGSTFTQQTTQAGALTSASAFTDWAFDDSACPTVISNDNEFADAWGGPPVPCPALSRCQTPNVDGNCPMMWLSGVSLHEGNLLGATQYCGPGFCFQGCLVWY